MKVILRLIGFSLALGIWMSNPDDCSSLRSPQFSEVTASGGAESRLASMAGDEGKRTVEKDVRGRRNAIPKVLQKPTFCESGPRMPIALLSAFARCWRLWSWRECSFL